MTEKNFEMMTLEKIINDVVLIILNDVEALKPVGIKDKQLYAHVRGYDDFGLWVEHPRYEIIISEDESGKPLPTDKIKRERFDASIQIQWRNIVTIVHFPNREGYDFPGPFERHIGFIPNNSEDNKKDES